MVALLSFNVYRFIYSRDSPPTPWRCWQSKIRFTPTGFEILSASCAKSGSFRGRRPPPPRQFCGISRVASSSLSPPRPASVLSLARAARSIDLDGALCICLHLHPARTACVPFASPRVQHVPFLAARLASRPHHELFLHQRAISSKLTLIYAILSGRRSTMIDRMRGGRRRARSRARSGRSHRQEEPRATSALPNVPRIAALQCPHTLQCPLARLSVAVLPLSSSVLSREL